MLDRYRAEVIMYSIQAYGSLMPKGQPFTLAQLAQQIRSTYQMAGERGVAMLQVLEANGHKVASFI